MLEVNEQAKEFVAMMHQMRERAMQVDPQLVIGEISASAAPKPQQP